MEVILKVSNRLLKEKKIQELISYCYLDSIFGRMLWASDSDGICFVGFENDGLDAIQYLNQRYKNVVLQESNVDAYNSVLSYFLNDSLNENKVKIHLIGSDFEIKVWQALLNIPFGQTVSYSKIARNIGYDKAYRAVGSAIGRNPVAVLLPCHRVLDANNQLSGYRWGVNKKAEILKWEKANKSLITLE